ncbi:MAG: DUF3667 domain-containing protein [Bacteroidota bacterium]
MQKTSENEEHQPKESRQTLERIDKKYIWNEISSVLNFDKGLFYTIRELFIRPGKTVREFLLYDRKRLVKPIIFVIFSSLLFVISEQIFGFETGSSPDNIKSEGIRTVFEWVGQNFGVFNIVLAFFVGFWARLFFLKSKFNLYEMFILMFFAIGVGNLIFTLFGILESATSLDVNGVAYLAVIVYSTWAIGNFFHKGKILSYFLGFLAYLFGSITGSALLLVIGTLMDLFNKGS